MYSAYIISTFLSWIDEQKHTLMISILKVKEKGNVKLLLTGRLIV